MCFPAVQLLYWDKTNRLGQTDAVFAALELAAQTLLPYENLHLYGFLMDPEIVTNLDITATISTAPVR